MKSQHFFKHALASLDSVLHPRFYRAMDIEGTTVSSPAGDLFVYEETKGEGMPVVLVHSVNAAASSFEMRPLFEALRGKRPVLAFDLPGFGRSQRGAREYDRGLYQSAVLAMVQRAAAHNRGAAHVVALSLGCEFAGAAAVARPDLVRSLALISPTGLGSSAPRVQQNAVNGRPERALRLLSTPLVGAPLFAAVASRPSIHYFLSKSFVGPVDKGLERYAYVSAHQPGARHAPLAFLSGGLFHPEAMSQIYERTTCPVLVIHDKDAYTDFARLPEILRRPNWTAARIAPTLGLPQFEKLDRTLEVLNVFWTPLDAEDARMAEARQIQPGY